MRGMVYRLRNPALAGPGPVIPTAEPHLVHPAIKDPPSLPGKVISPHPRPFPQPVAPRGILRPPFAARNLNVPPDQGGAPDERPAWMQPGMPYQGFRGLGSAVATYLPGPTAAEAEAGANNMGVAVEYGMKGEGVAELQRMLTAVGFPPQGGVDGFFGPNTKAALEAWVPTYSAALAESLQANKDKAEVMRVIWRTLRTQVNAKTRKNDGLKAGIAVLALGAAGLAVWKLS